MPKVALIKTPKTDGVGLMRSLLAQSVPPVLTRLVDLSPPAFLFNGVGSIKLTWPPASLGW